MPSSYQVVNHLALREGFFNARGQATVQISGTSKLGRWTLRAIAMERGEQVNCGEIVIDAGALMPAKALENARSWIDRECRLQGLKLLSWAGRSAVGSQQVELAEAMVVLYARQYDGSKIAPG